MKKPVRKTKKRVPKSSKLIIQERGLSKVMLLAIVAIILAVGGGVYILSQNGSLNKALPVAKAPLNPNCEKNDPELCKFLNNYVNMPKSYSVTSSGNYDGMSTESLYEVDGTDKFHMVSKLNGKENSNIISIADIMYTLDYSDKKWVKMISQPVETMEEDKATEVVFDPEEVEDTTTYKFITKESCGDFTCFKYEMVMTDAGEGKMYIWFDDRDYLMRKTRMEDPTGGASESVYSYGNMVITAPSPVKEGDAYSVPAGGMNEADAQRLLQKYQQTAESGEIPTFDAETPVDTSSEEGY